MIKVTVEVQSGVSYFKASVWARSIEGALAATGTRYPGAMTRVVFPIEPEGFFVRGEPPAVGTVAPEASEEAAG